MSFGPTFGPSFYCDGCKRFYQQQPHFCKAMRPPINFDAIAKDLIASETWVWKPKYMRSMLLTPGDMFFGREEE